LGLVRLNGRVNRGCVGIARSDRALRSETAYGEHHDGGKHSENGDHY